MKNISKIMMLPLMIAAFLVAGPAAKANPYQLSIVLDDPSQSGLPGTTLDFTGTITNLDPSVQADLFADSFTLSPGISEDDSAFYLIPEFLGAGANTGDVDLFALTIASGTPFGVYAEDFQILDSNGNVIGDVDFDINVTPEPGSLLLLGTGLLLLVGMIRWRGLKLNSNTPA